MIFSTMFNGNGKNMSLLHLFLLEPSSFLVPIVPYEMLLKDFMQLANVHAFDSGCRGDQRCHGLDLRFFSVYMVSLNTSELIIEGFI
jgi:hypothetical protein